MNIFLNIHLRPALCQRPAYPWRTSYRTSRRTASWRGPNHWTKPMPPLRKPPGFTFRARLSWPSMRSRRTPSLSPAPTSATPRSSWTAHRPERSQQAAARVGRSCNGPRWQSVHTERRITNSKDHEGRTIEAAQQTDAHDLARHPAALTISRCLSSQPARRQPGAVLCHSSGRTHEHAAHNGRCYCAGQRCNDQRRRRKLAVGT